MYALTRKGLLRKKEWRILYPTIDTCMSVGDIKRERMRLEVGLLFDIDANYRMCKCGIEVVSVERFYQEDFIWAYQKLKNEGLVTEV